MKLGIGYPWSSPFMFTCFGEHLANLENPPGWAIRFFRGTGWCPARRHIDLCEQALDWGADLICIIGADQIHPVDMLPRLVARWNQGYEVVSAMVPVRGYVGWQDMKPFQPMAWRWKRDLRPNQNVSVYRGMHLDSDMIDVVNPQNGDMQEVDFIGTGVLMFHRDHLLALKRPWFYETIREEDFQRVANQDCKFVMRLKTEAHAKIWVDTTIAVKHAHVFEIDETYSDRFTDWAWNNGDPRICRYGVEGNMDQGGYLYRMTNQNGVHRMRRDLVLHWSGDLSGKRVLEVGSDDGTYMDAFSRAGAREVVGVDPEREPKIELPQGCRFVRMKVEDLIHEGDFDLIHMGEVLEHVDDAPTLLACVTRRWPNAILILSVPNFKAERHKRTFTMESFLAEITPYISVEDTQAIRWKSPLVDEIHMWFCAKGRAKQREAQLCQMQ